MFVSPPSAPHSSAQGAQESFLWVVAAASGGSRLLRRCAPETGVSMWYWDVYMYIYIYMYILIYIYI